MRIPFLVAIVLMPSTCFAQYPAQIQQAYELLSPGVWAYSPQAKSKFMVTVKAPRFQQLPNGDSTVVSVPIGYYAITDSQWGGMKANIERFCRQQKLKVDSVQPLGTNVVVTLA